MFYGAIKFPGFSNKCGGSFQEKLSAKVASDICIRAARRCRGPWRPPPSTEFTGHLYADQTLSLPLRFSASDNNSVRLELGRVGEIGVEFDGYKN